MLDPGKRHNPKFDLETLDSHSKLLNMIEFLPWSPAKTVVTKTLEAAYGDDGPERVAEYLITTLAEENKSISQAIAAVQNMPAEEVVSKCSALIVNEFLSPMAGKKGPEGDASSGRSPGFKTDVGVRDRHTCRVTDRIDRQIYANTALPTQGTERLGRLERAHIAPLAALRNKTVALFVEKFTGGIINKKVLDNIDTVVNGMVLQHDAHRDYDDYLWSVKVENGRFKVISRNKGSKLSFIDGGKELEFSNLPETNFGKPDVRFFELHRVVGDLLQATANGRKALMQGV